MMPEAQRQGQKKGQGQRARVRLGAGEYSPTGAPNPVARLLYLQAVAICVPEAFTALMRADDVNEWVRLWGFEDQWALDVVLVELPFWRENPEAVGRAWIVRAAYWEPVAKAISWDPITETEDVFRARVEAYIESSKAGLARTPTKESPAHFEWLALHHVGRWTLARIQEKYQDQGGKPDVPAISRAVTELATVIGLTLRPGRGRKLRR